MKESYAIETRHLTKRYGEQVAVNDVCLHVPKGHIYGLLGRNGAGKTSIMKLILQLMPATSGETLLFGEQVKRRERGVFQRIGAIIETPGFYPNLTGTENLEIFAKLRGTIRPDAVEHALQVVGLPYKDKKLFGEYSLGMKQRLGIVGNLGTISKLYPLVAAFTLSGYYESTPAEILLSVISMVLCGMISGILIYRLSKRDALQ